MRTGKGFTLIEIAVVLVILSLVLSMGISMTGRLLVQQKRYSTSTRLVAIDGALAVYAAQMQRLPCPADGALPPSDNMAGVEQRDGVSGDCLNNQARGVVPWTTIGLSEADATDGFFGRMTYRVGLGLTRNGAMTLAACDPAGSAPAVGTPGYQSCAPACDNTLVTCTPPQAVVAGRGLAVRNAGGATILNPAGVPATGAAYIVVSHGENRAGAYSNEGTLQEAVGVVGGGEGTNSADQALQAFYVDDSGNFSETAAHFDDILSRPTILTVATKANLGPRAH